MYQLLRRGKNSSYIRYNIKRKSCTIPNRKLILRGKFSSKIKEEALFDLLLFYPQLEIKCKVYQAKEMKKLKFLVKFRKYSS